MSAIQRTLRKPKINTINLETETLNLLAVLIVGQFFHHSRVPGKSIMQSFRCCLGIVLSMGLSLCASTTATAQSPSPSVANNQGQYLLLDNDQVLSGTVFRQGAYIILRRGNEAELTLRAAQVVAVADDLPALYQARIRSQRRRSSATLVERISDVRWCIDNSMPAHATEALMSVYAVAPNHPVAIQLEGRLRRLLERPEPSSPATIATAQFSGNLAGANVIENVSHAEPEAMPIPTVLDSKTLVHASSVPATLHEFTSKIQPILLSRCSQCHHQQSGIATNWNLDLPPGGSTRLTQRGSLANLDATRKFCTPANPKQSELYLKAITAHGDTPTAKPPIAEYEVNLARALIHWIATLDVEARQQPEIAPAPNNVAPVAFTTSVEPNFPPLSPINPADVAGSLSSLKPYHATPESPGDRNIGWNSANQVRPSRLPVIDNSNDVEHFNRETRLRRRLGLH